MEGRRNKKRKKDRKEEGIQGERRKEKRRKEKKKRSYAGHPVCGRGGRVWLEGLFSLFSLPEPHTSLLFSLQSGSPGSFCSPLGL